MAFSAETRQIPGSDPDGPCYELAWQDNTGGPIPCFIARDFNVGQAAVAEFTADWKVNDVAGRSRAGFGMLRSAEGAGIAVVVDNLGGGSWSLSIGVCDTWSQYGSMVATVGSLPTLVAGSKFRIHLKATVNEDDSTRVVATVRTTADVDIGSVTATLNVARGDYFGFYGTFEQLGGTSTMRIYSARVQASGSTNYVAQPTATSYVYRFVNDLGEASAPGPASATVLRPDGVSVTVTTPTAVPLGTDPDYQIVAKQLFRAVNGASGTVFVLVAEIPLAQADFVDTLDDTAIADNEVLDTAEDDLPPADLQGILALPNGIMAGFRRNQLCLSGAGRPHGWPVRFRLPTDVDIVAIANIDNTVVIGTRAHVYTATGNEPGSYSMSKPGAAQACTSKPSMVNLPGFGVVFASPDGFMACAGSAGDVRNISEGFFSRRQWQALDPTSVRCEVHDGMLFFWTTGGGARGWILDPRANGFGLVRLSAHAAASHVDALNDALFLRLSANAEPTDADLPLASTAVAPNGQRVYEFDAGASDMVYVYRGRLNELPRDAAMIYARVRAAGYANLVVRFYADGVLVKKKVVSSDALFTLPAPEDAAAWEIELMGTSTVRSAAAAEDALELT
ncbi:hypothetical protein ABXN37_19915 [Piscinibacter sakaiensis]|uniref:Conserved phage protein n=1 Tax=Piscinibacter sakaiensis TaxID=1547922 RepID=A0A0K8P440_PISS1|nr:hypothetical protein [Piscinibacter sakaiensis]GAP37392.1 conserved phage protein [Piscinibacter sakaiensis]